MSERERERGVFRCLNIALVSKLGKLSCPNMDSAGVCRSGRTGTGVCGGRVVKGDVGMGISSCV